MFLIKKCNIFLKERDWLLSLPDNRVHNSKRNKFVPTKSKMSEDNPYNVERAKFLLELYQKALLLPEK